MARWMSPSRAFSKNIGWHALACQPLIATTCIKGSFMSEASTLPKPKKSVALSGVAAGNTALCPVGRSGNDLHYRGYDILDFAERAEFEEVSYLLVHGKLPTRNELSAPKAKLRARGGLPAALRQSLEALPASSHPMDVLRSGCSVLGCLL